MRSKSSISSPTPAGARWRRPRRGPRWSTLTPRRTLSPGHGETPSFPDWLDAPIRWIAEDALKFVKRELKRGNRYDAVILDPPSYGHGPRGEVWRLSKHLPRLLALCGELTAGRAEFMLLTCHTPGYEADQLAEMIKEHCIPAANGIMEAGPLSIRAADGRKLPSGVMVRWKLTSE